MNVLTGILRLKEKLKYASGIKRLQGFNMFLFYFVLVNENLLMVHFKVCMCTNNATSFMCEVLQLGRWVLKGYCFQLH